MNGIGGWFRQFSAKLTAALRNFMAGRYGTDQLNNTILICGIILSLGSAILTSFVYIPLLNLGMTLVSYVLLGWALFRTFSRQTYKRYRENQRYLQFIKKLKDRDHRYFACPRCRQQVRVPKGKGKISISCPKCKEKFIKKT